MTDSVLFGSTKKFCQISTAFSIPHTAWCIRNNPGTHLCLLWWYTWTDTRTPSSPPSIPHVLDASCSLRWYKKFRDRSFAKMQMVRSAIAEEEGREEKRRGCDLSKSASEEEDERRATWNDRPEPMDSSSLSFWPWLMYAMYVCHACMLCMYAMYVWPYMCHAILLCVYTLNTP